MHQDDDVFPPVEASDLDNRLTRRQLLKAGAAGGLTLGVSGLLSACGSSSSTATSSATSSSAGASSSASAAPSSSASLTAAEKATILKALGPINAASSGKGVTWKVGAALALSGPTAYTGQYQDNGIQLGVSHIQQLGGPLLDFDTIDNGGATDPKLGVDAMIKFKDAGVPVVLSSVYNGLGSMTPGAQRDHILCIDAGAGNGLAPGVNYFWGACSAYPVDAYAGVLGLLKTQFPHVKKVTIAYPNLGSFFGPYVKAATQQLTAQGLTVQTVPLTLSSTNFTNNINTIRAQNPDFVILMNAGLDPGYFMKDYVVSGLTKPVIGFQIDFQTLALGGKAMEGMYFAHDAFNAYQPENDWAKVFVSHYHARFNSLPPAGAAMFYVETFLLWRLMQDVLASHGDIKDGAKLQATLQAHGVFPTVLGGNGTNPGALTLDPKTHGVAKQPMVVTQIKNGHEVNVARFQTGPTPNYTPV